MEYEKLSPKLKKIIQQLDKVRDLVENTMVLFDNYWVICAERECYEVKRFYICNCKSSNNHQNQNIK
jgi:hypothetical protein